MQVQFHTTKEADRCTYPIYLDCFQGNNAAESKVILSQVCISAGLMVNLYSQSVMRKCSKMLTVIVPISKQVTFYVS